jgi:hypothetical protein
MPVPVAEAANGNSPVVAVPKREPASGHREQQTLKHCLQKVLEVNWKMLGSENKIITYKQASSSSKARR